MNKSLILFFLFTLTFFGVSAQDIPPKPNPPRLVNDFANQLSEGEKASLEQKLVAYNDSTSSQITVVIIKTTGDYPIADYAFKLGREWGVGQKDKDNGIVLLWASTDRKVFIATGYGLEGAIPDAIAKRIVSTVIIPQFKNNQFYQGLDQGVDMIFKYATGEYKADAKDVKDPRDGGSGSPFLTFAIIFIIILIIIFRNRRGGRGGGGLGNFGGPIIWPYTTHSGRGSFSGNWGGGGGDGGGFGGFGGGSFGGGGAGGDY